MTGRVTTGLDWLDEMLGGGLLPGTLCLVHGATGIGKTHLGLHFAHAGRAAEGREGLLLDMVSRGDSQSHLDYARRMFGWEPAVQPVPISGDGFWEAGRRWEYLHAFDYTGRPVERGAVSQEEWRAWNLQLQEKIRQAAAFCYHGFVRGSRRVVVDGIEPAANPADSIQHRLFEYLYHQVLHRQHDWLAREVFREHFLANRERVMACPYDHQAVTTMFLQTTHEVGIDEMLLRPLPDSGLEANANTVIMLGKRVQGGAVTRHLHVAKHRGSACSTEVAQFAITAKGLVREG